MRLILIFLFLIQLGFSNELNSQIDLTQKEQTYLKQNTITVNITTSWIPFHYKNDQDKIIGIALDFWNLVAKKAKIQFKIIEAKNFTEVLNNIKSKKHDINIATTQTKDNKKYSIFTTNYEKYPIAIATRDNERFIDGTASLEDKKVAVGKNYSAYYLLQEKYPKIDFVFTKNVKEALEFVQKGKAFAAVDIEPSLYFQIAKNNYENLKVTRSDVYFDLQMMIRSDKVILQSILNKLINSITKDEKIQIYKKWVNKRNESRIDYQLVWQVIIVFLLILSIITIAYCKQKKLHKKIAVLNRNLEKRVIEETKKNELQQLFMLQQSRLAQMGEMLSMIAHQWRQPLNNLAVINQSLILKYRKNKLTQKVIDNFHKNTNLQIQNMSKTIDDFKNFFKPEKEKVSFHLNRKVNEMVRVLEPICNKYSLEIIVSTKDEYHLLGYPNEFGQAIINILNNAKDALIENKIENKKIWIELTHCNDEVILDISDNAKGISDKIIDKIFDPYFSTKNDKNGTGLGLYMTKLIIEDHMGGEIKVSNTNYGAKFSITLNHPIKDSLNE